MDEVFLSVVTPSYQQAEFIKDNLESVMKQSGANVEHIVVDGGSQDGTVEILREYENRYELRWNSEPDDGQSQAINKGLEMARGEWIWWVNSDDYLLPGAVESLARVADRHPESDMIYGDYVFVDRDGDTVGRKYSVRPSKFVHRHYYQFTGNHSTIIRREVARLLGGVDEDLDYVMDTEFLWRLLEADIEMTRIQSFIGARRLHGDAKTTGEPPPARQAEIRELRERYGPSRTERLVPNSLLAAAAFGLEAVYHVMDGRPEALRHMIT